MPTPITNCISDIIGVTNNTLIPFYDELDSDIQDLIISSKSQLYMDTLTGGIDLMMIDDKDYMISVLNLALQAKAEAEKILQDELLLAINTRFIEAKPRFNGFIGLRPISATSASSGELQGHRLRMIEPIAGNIIINKVSVNISGSTDFNVYIAVCNAYEKQIQQVLYTLPVTSTAGSWSDCDISDQGGQIILPMEIEGIEQEYYIYWKRSEAGGAFPKNNEIVCISCLGKKTTRALEEFMDFKGISFASTDNVRNASIDRLGHGISLSAVVQCDQTMVICREYDKKDAIRLMMNKAAQYKAGELWIEYILKSGVVNKVALQSREYMYGKRNNFSAEFSKRITAIADSMTLGETACYTCKQDKVIKGGIFS